MAALDRRVVAPGLSPSSKEDAVGRLFENHRLNLVRLAVFLTDDRAIAEDLVQDAFAVLYRRWDQLNEPAAALGYLRTSIINAVRSRQRRQVLARRHLRALEPGAGPSADYALLLDEEHREVIAALHRLPRRQREVLVLRYWGALSEAEIAETLHISRGTVKSTASRALDALERQLGKIR